jgi:acetyl-CoA decarbonylase/synthase complex subunit beta
MVATEEDAADVDSLRNFLKEKNHPILERWVEEEEEAPEEEEATEAAPQAGFAPQMQMPTNFMPSMPMMGGSGSGGVKIVLKNAKVSIEKVIIKKQD